MKNATKKTQLKKQIVELKQGKVVQDPAPETVVALDRAIDAARDQNHVIEKDLVRMAKDGPEVGLREDAALVLDPVATDVPDPVNEDVQEVDLEVVGQGLEIEDVDQGLETDTAEVQGDVQDPMIDPTEGDLLVALQENEPGNLTDIALKVVVVRTPHLSVKGGRTRRKSKIKTLQSPITVVPVLCKNRLNRQSNLQNKLF